MIQPPSEAVVPIRIEVEGSGVGDGDGEGEAGADGDAAGLEIAGGPVAPVVAAPVVGEAAADGMVIDGISPQPEMSITEKSSHRSALCTPCS
jgi:hypothetical protein